MHLDKVYSKLVDTLSASLNDTRKYFVICASLDHHNNILSIGQNSYQKTHPMQSRLAIKSGNASREYLHAEIASLVKNRVKPSAIVVVRMTAGGLIRMARPCNICTLALREAGVRYVYYTNDDGILCLDELHY